MKGPRSFMRMTSRGKMECSVVLLDNSVFTTEFPDKLSVGQELLKQVLEHLMEIDGEYFGLQYVDSDGDLTWLDPKRQIKGQRSKPYNFQLALKYFPRNVNVLREKTLLQVRLQIKDSLIRGKISCSEEQHAMLDAYYVQAILGDYKPRQNLGYTYLSEKLGSQIIEPNGINCDVESDSRAYKRRVAKLHFGLKGMTVDEANKAYIEFAMLLPHYGCPIYKATDKQETNPVVIAVTERGISIFSEDMYQKPGTLQQEFNWEEIVTTVCQYKRFCIISYSTDPSRNGSFVFKFHGSFGNLNALRLQNNVTDYKNFFHVPDKNLNRRSKSFSEKDSMARLSSMNQSSALEPSSLRRTRTGGKSIRRFTYSLRKKFVCSLNQQSDVTESRNSLAGDFCPVGD